MRFQISQPDVLYPSKIFVVKESVQMEWSRLQSSAEKASYSPLESIISCFVILIRILPNVYTHGLLRFLSYTDIRRGKAYYDAFPESNTV